MEVDPSVFRVLLDYLNTTKNPMNQILGMAFRKGFPPDLSKRSWTNPRLHYLVMKIALVLLPPDFLFTSAQLFKDDAKLDSHNKGKTYMIRFGSYTGGELVLKTPTDTEHNILGRPMIFDCSETEHYFKEAVGTCWTLAFYNLTTKQKALTKLSDFEAVFESGKWSIAWHRPGQPITYLSKKFGLNSVTKKKEEEQRTFLGPLKKCKPEALEDDTRFSTAQNLMIRAAQLSATLNTE